MTTWEAQASLLAGSTLGGGSGGEHAEQAALPTGVLTSGILASLAAEISDSPDVCTASSFYQALGDRVTALVHDVYTSSPHQPDGSTTVQQLLEAGAACVQTFMRHNLSGPWRPPPPSPLALLAPRLADSHSGAALVAPIQAPDEATISPAPNPLGEPTADYTASANGAVGAASSTGLGTDMRHPHEQWAGLQLAVDGEELHAGGAALQYLLLAELLLVQPLLGPVLQPPQVTTQQGSLGRAGNGSPAQVGGKQRHGIRASAVTWAPGVQAGLLAGWPTWGLWAQRATLAHHQLLDGRSALLLARTQRLTAALLSAWVAPAVQLVAPGAAAAAAAADTAAAAAAAPRSDDACVQGLAASPDLLATVLLELAQGQLGFGYVEAGQRLLEDAGAVLGLEVKVTGIMGRRTVHQVDDKAQLVVVATNRRPSPAAALPTDLPIAELGLGLLGGGGRAAASGQGHSGDVAQSPERETAGLEVYEDVMMVPQLRDEAGQVLESRYRGAEQALLLSWANHIRTASAQDELQAWEMAPYVEAVLLQPCSQLMLQVYAHLLKARHEKERSRTRERALLHMEQLVEVLAGADGEQGGHRTARRGAFAFATACPLAPRLRRELAEQYMSLGFVGAAMKLFESLEAWGPLVLCYRLLDKRAAADQLIRARLQVTPNDPSLWCSLGDLHLDDSHYETAWQRSGRRHARSKRSLGRSAIRRKDWAAAVQHYEAALALNPLNPDAWFSLGYAHLKLPGQELPALRAFTRVTQQQPDHSEAWNNMAALWMALGRHKEAYSALSQCIKYKRDSWQIWDNYAAVAVKAGAPLAAVQGLRQVLQLSSGQQLSLETLAEIVETLSPDYGTGSAALDEAQAAEGDAAGLEGEEDDLGDWLLAFPGLTARPGQTSAADADVNGLDASHEAEGAAEAHLGADAVKDAADADERAREQLKTALGQLLKGAVNQPACKPGLWGCLGRFYALTGAPESAKEAYLKQVRALSGTSYRSDRARFEEMATASLALSRAYVALYQQSSAAGGAKPAARELAAARMHLRGVLKQCEASFGEAAAFQDMQGLLLEVQALEQQAVAGAPTPAT